MPTIDEFLDSYTPPAQAGQALNIANGYAKPEDAALALKTARESGLPAETVDLDPAGFAQQQRQRENARILEANQSLSAFIGENPVEGKAIHDDLDKLDFFTKQLTAIKSGWHRGVIGEKLGFVGSQMAVGLGGEEEALGLEERIAAQPEFKSGVEHYVQGAAGMFGQLFVDASLAGAAAGVGAVGGTVLGPVGAGAGAAAGGVAGFASAMGTAQAGRTFIETGKLRDENGQPLPLAHRRAAAGLVGVVAGALGMLGIKGNAAEIAAPIIRDATITAMENPGFRDALAKGAGELARGGTTGAAMMGTLAAVQEGVIDAAKGLSDGDWKTLANDPKRRQEVVSAINQAMVEGAVLVGGLHTPGVAANFVRDAAAIRQSKADATALDSALQAAKNTQTAARSPEALAALIRHEVGDQVIGVPVEAIDKVLAAKPDALSFVPELARQMEEARAAGTDVKLPLAEFLANAGDDVKTALRDEVRMREDGLTPKEAKELEESPPDYAAVAYHGSPHIFDAFDMSKIGTGEGAQSYGHGLYFAEAPGVAGSYKENLTNERHTVNGKPLDQSDPEHQALLTLESTGGNKSEAIAEMRSMIEEDPGFWSAAIKYLETTKDLPTIEKSKNEGALYQVRLKLDPERTILYDRPLSEQPKGVQEIFQKLQAEMLSKNENSSFATAESIETGATLTARLSQELGSEKAGAERLREAGIQGIKYLDQDSRMRNPNFERESKRLQNMIANHERIVEQAIKDDESGLIPYTKEGREYDNTELTRLREELTDLERRQTQPQTHNYVILDDKLIEITHRNGEAVVKQKVIEAATREQRANWLDPLLRPEGDKPPLGMTEAQYAAYSRKLEQLAAATERKAEALATREVAKRQSPEWKRNLAEITDEVRNDLRYEPRILVDSYLRDGVLGNQTVGAGDRLRLDRAAVEAILGDKEQLPKGTTVAKGGIHPDELASMLGYNSGQKMLMDLMELHRTRQVLGETPAKHFERLVSEEAARRMEQRYGRLDENIAREAQEMVVQQAQTEVLGAELEALARGGDFPLDRQSLEAATHELFADMPLERAADYKGFMRAIARLGREAEMALLKGDVEAAFLAKQRQWQAHIMAQGAKQLEKDYGRFERLVKRFREPVLASVDQAYTDQIQGIMASFGMPSKRNPAELQSALRTPLVEFVDRKRQDGRELPVAAFLMDGSAPPFAELTTQQFHALHDSLTTLAHNGKEERLITREGEKVELQGMIAEAMGRFNQEPLKVQPFDPNAWDKTKAFFRSFDVALVKAEQMFQWLDKNDPTGVFTGVFQRFAKAKYAEHDMLTEIAGKVKELKGDAAFQKKLRNRLDNDRLFDWNTGELAQFTGRDLIAIMLHMGTESNLNKLTAKFEWGGMQRGWDRADVEAFVNRHATKEHWDLVQGIWDLNNNYFWPKIEEHSRRLAGIAPDKLEPRKITTPFGEYEGGYSPVDRDPRWPHGGGDVADGLFRETQFRNAIPKKDYTLTRTEAAYPVWINFESVFNGMRETVHDLAYRESLMDGVKFLRAPKIREGIQQTLGKEYADSIQPWLEHMAKGKLMDDATLSGIQSLSRWARQRLVMVELVGRASTIVKHSMAALLDSVGEVGVKDFATAAMDVYGNVPNIPSTLRPILERSGELRSRWHAWDRDLKEMANRNLTGELSVRERAALFMSYPLAVLDQMSAVPVFVAAERRFLEQGHPPEQAALMADTVVRNAHGAAGAPDLPPLLRASEGYKLLTVAYTFFNHNYNRVRNIGRETVEGGRDFGKGNVAEAFGHWTKAASLTFWYVILMGMYERWVTHGGPDEDKEESVGAWAAKGVTHQLAGNLPAVRDVAMPILGYLDDKKLTPGGPFSSVAKAVYDVVNTTGKYAKTDELSGSWWAHYARGVGYAAGLPGSGQVAVTGQFLWDLESGRQYADDIPSMLRGLSMGKAHPHERLGR